MNQHITMRQLPESERPYEKLWSQGAETLSDAELLAIILKTGTKDQSSLDIARQILSSRQGNLLNLYEMELQELCSFPGIGKVKAMQLKAIAELSKRIARTNRGYHINMSSPSSIADYFMEKMRHLKQEILMVALFDSKCNLLTEACVSSGSTSYAYVSPKDILRKVLESNATTFVLLHNHPSGDPNPSKDDIRVTQRLRECAKLMDLHFADHIIIGDNCYFSFLENYL